MQVIGLYSNISKTFCARDNNYRFIYYVFKNVMLDNVGTYKTPTSQCTHFWRISVGL